MVLYVVTGFEIGSLLRTLMQHEFNHRITISALGRSFGPVDPMETICEPLNYDGRPNGISIRPLKSINQCFCWQSFLPDNEPPCLGHIQEITVLSN